MPLYRWDTDIGEVLAQASDVDSARVAVMATLSEKDVARNDLANAIAGEPEVVEGPIAVVAWHQ